MIDGEKPHVNDWVRVTHGKHPHVYEFEGEVEGVNPTQPEATVRCFCCGLSQSWSLKHITRLVRHDVQ